MRKPVRHGHPVERLVERQHEARDRRIVIMMAMIMVRVMIVMRMAGVRIWFREGPLVEPALDVYPFQLGIDQAPRCPRPGHSW